MATQEPNKQSIFPDMPRETPAVDQNGNLMALWQLGLSALFQALQQNFKNEGILFPPLSQDNMDTIESLYASYVGGTYNNLTLNLPDISGQTVYDTTTEITNQFVISKDAATPANVILAKWVPLTVMLTSAGDPNGNTSGILNWLCLDTVGHVLYVCTASGATTTATWVAL